MGLPRSRFDLEINVKVIATILFNILRQFVIRFCNIFITLNYKKTTISMIKINKRTNRNVDYKNHSTSKASWSFMTSQVFTRDHNQHIICLFLWIFSFTEFMEFNFDFNIKFKYLLITFLLSFQQPAHCV